MSRNVDVVGTTDETSSKLGIWREFYIEQFGLSFEKELRVQIPNHGLVNPQLFVWAPGLEVELLLERFCRELCILEDILETEIISGQQPSTNSIIHSLMLNDMHERITCRKRGYVLRLEESREPDFDWLGKSALDVAVAKITTLTFPEFLLLQLFLLLTSDYEGEKHYLDVATTTICSGTTVGVNQVPFVTVDRARGKLLVTLENVSVSMAKTGPRRVFHAEDVVIYPLS